MPCHVSSTKLTKMEIRNCICVDIGTGLSLPASGGNDDWNNLESGDICQNSKWKDPTMSSAWNFLCDILTQDIL